MQRPLVALAGLSCVLFFLCLVANVVAIRGAAPGGARTLSLSLTPPPPSLEPVDPPAATARGSQTGDEEDQRLRERATQLVADSLASRLGRLGEAAAQNPQLLSDATVSSDLLLTSEERGTWVTRTEVRVPCAKLDRFLAELRDPKLGPPRHCERWVEATAERLEQYGISDVGAREFLSRYGGDQSIRVLWVYAGWKPASNAAGADLELVTAQSAPIFPGSEASELRRAALTQIYETLELGPHRHEELEESG